MMLIFFLVFLFLSTIGFLCEVLFAYILLLEELFLRAVLTFLDELGPVYFSAL